MLSELATRRGSEEGGKREKGKGKREKGKGKREKGKGKREKGKGKGNHAHIRDKGGNRLMKVNE